MLADYIIEPILLKETKRMNTPLLLDQLTVFELSGKDATTFLENQIISNLPENKDGIYTAICNPKGRIQYSLFIFKKDEGFFVAVNDDLSDNFFHYVSLRKFRMNFSINKSNQRLVTQSEQTPNNAILPLQVMKPDDSPQSASNDQFWQFIFKIELPWITKKTAELFIPQHVNLDQKNIVAFDKGCYPGQEIIARLHYLGTVKKRMQLVTVDKFNSHISGESVYIPEFNEKVDICSPAIKNKLSWQFQAICPVK
ncbi:MAG: hypothetical protein R3E90_15225 [Marinicella sp.]